MRRSDKLYTELCDEVDYWRQEAEHWEKECKKAREEHVKSMNFSIDSSKECIGIMLEAALDPDSIINRGHKHALEEQIGKTSKQKTTPAAQNA